jgi:hypothetical protein
VEKKYVGLAAIIQRSVFHLVPVQQDIAILADDEWYPTEDVKLHIRNCHARVISSQVCEDAFNRQKNSKKAPNRRGVVERAWSTLLDKKVVQEVCREKMHSR